MSAAASAATRSDSRAASASASGASPPPPRSSHFHRRGDALDIPFIDHHLLTQLLFPRLVSAIQLVFPQVYLDWTTTAGTTTSASLSNSSQYKTLRWKRIVEGILRTCLIVGSCRRIIVRYHTSKQHHHQPTNHQDHEKVNVITPAMHNLGMQIRPSASSSSSSSSSRRDKIIKNSSGWINLVQQYVKVGTLILATIIIPTLFKELKIYRKRQLEDRDRQLRMEDIRNEEYQLFHSSSSVSSSSPSSSSSRSTTDTGGRTIGEVSSTENPQRYHRNHYNFDPHANDSILHQRAQKRQSRLITYLIDTTLGMGEVFLPPLQLVNYVLYLWGRSCTPHLGMQLAGWEYCNIDDHHEGYNDVGGGIGEEESPHHHYQQRHVNFQYAHRRLLVEEGLRAVSMIIPPSLPSHLRIDNGTSGGNQVVENNARAGEGTMGVAAGRHNLNHEGDTGSDSDSTRRTTREGENISSRRRRRGWTMMRKKISSFMGVIDEEDEINAAATTTSTSTSEARRYSLTCSMCHMENPSIPYIASCGHCYCYLCLRMAVTDNLSFRCVDCGRAIISSARPKPEVFVGEDDCRR